MNLLNFTLFNLFAEFTDPFASLPLQLNYGLKILIGGLLGLIMGWERSRRQKEAGLATHFVVGCAATLFTCISIQMADIGDGERIAAQVVSGVGFLGAGMIFFRRESLRGLTTAAGIWATAAIGMCVATGMLWLACGATVIIILVQVLLHSKLIKRNRQHLVLVKMEYSEEARVKLLEYFGCSNFHRFKVTATENTDDKKMIAETVIYPTKNCLAMEITDFLEKNPEILSIERLEDL